MDFKVRRLAACGDAVAGCGGMWQDHPGPKEEVSKLGVSNIRVFESSRLEGLLGLLEGGWNNEV